MLDFLKKIFSNKEKDQSYEDFSFTTSYAISENKSKECVLLKSVQNRKNTFIGGMPHSGKNLDWPRKKNHPLSFIAQIDLSEVNSRKSISWLPNKGILLFFYDLKEWPWGFDPKDRGGWSVIFDVSDVDDRVDHTKPFDLGDNYCAPNKKYLIPKNGISYPSLDRINGDFSDEEIDDYCDKVSECAEDEPHHQIDGYPNPIQSDSMEEQCQLVTSGLYCGNSKAYSSEKAKALLKEKNEWKLLFQFDSDEDINAMWGDCGMLYFWIRESDAQNLDFSNAWLILQCS